MNPYRGLLLKLEGQEVVLHRAGAADLKGKLVGVGTEGCMVIQEIDEFDKVLQVFVSFSDIRGVGNIEWAHDVDF